MLKHTFLHIAGIGPKTERLLWKQGILTWEAFLNRAKPILSPARDEQIHRELDLSLQSQDNMNFFLNRLPQSEHWRMYESFKEQAVFVDIETSGGYLGMDEITVIGLYDGRKVQTFVNGRNLDDFEQAVMNYSVVITFNGSCFDLPYLKQRFKHISLPPAHIDLRFLLKKLGLRGGLKAIERQMGLVRDPSVEGLNGFDAVQLWKAYQWGDQSALDRLITYNTMDIVHLKPLMELSAGEMKRRLLSGRL